MSEIGRGMKDIQEFLSSPKLRGNIGEQVLKDLLTQMLPKKSFFLQHSFKSGVMVDAAIKTSAGIIPVDSKFPMDNFRKMTSAKNEKEKKDAEKTFVKDVKKHINDISSKYIMSRLHSTIKSVTEKFDNYYLDQIPKEVEELFLELSRTYIQLNRDSMALGSDDEKKRF